MCGFALKWVFQEVREVKFFGYLNRFLSKRWKNRLGLIGKYMAVSHSCLAVCDLQGVFVCAQTCLHNGLCLSCFITVTDEDVKNVPQENLRVQL